MMSGMANGGNGKATAATSASASGLSREDSQTGSIFGVAGPAEIPGILRDPPVATARKWNTDIPKILPHERVFPIQIGSELFRLSGASISSDGMYSHLPSVLRSWFEEGGLIIESC